MAEPSPRRRRIVVRPPNWLGDAVLALPAMAAIRRHFAGDELIVAATAGVAALFREGTDADPDRVIDLPRAQRAAVTTLAGLGAEVGILFPNSIRSAWQFRRAGIAERWGMSRGLRDVLLTKRSARPPGRGLHQTDFYRGLVRGLGIDVDDRLPAVRASAASLAEARELLARATVDQRAALIGIAPGAAYGHAKQWPADRMAGVIARLVAAHDARCVLVGAAHDRPAAREIESWLRAHAPAALSRVVNLAGRTSLGALAGVASQCRVFISNDSGAMHLAAALGRPVVALFGPTDERATRPPGSHDVITAQVFCRPCLLRDCPIDHRCMKRITVDTVYDAVARRLAQGGVQP